MNASTQPDEAAHLKTMREKMELFTTMTPWAVEVGFRFDKIEQGYVEGTQPYASHLIGDPSTGVIHGGVISTFLDQLCGAAAISALETFSFVATLDLRIDYMKGADVGQDIYGAARCYHVTKSVAFVRAWAFHESPDAPIALAQGAFALNSSPGRTEQG